MILSEQNKEKEAIKFITQEFKKIQSPNVYEVYDFAAFLKNNENYEEATKHYSNVLKKIDKDHSLYAKQPMEEEYRMKEQNNGKKLLIF